MRVFILSAGQARFRGRPFRGCGHLARINLLPGVRQRMLRLQKANDLADNTLQNRIRAFCRPLATISARDGDLRPLAIRRERGGHARSAPPQERARLPRVDGPVPRVPVLGFVERRGGTPVPLLPPVPDQIEAIYGPLGNAHGASQEQNGPALS